MGTSMAFYQVRSQGWSREALQEIMSRSFRKKPRQSPEEAFFELLQASCGKETVDELKASWEQNLRQREDSSPFAFQSPQNTPSATPAVGYRTDASWLPFFDVNICEGYNASSRDTRRLSKAFGAPVLAFSIFDSDILMVSYSDAAKDLDYDYAKPNCEEMEEYDTDIFKIACPTFLLDLCPQLTTERLTEIWEGDEVFADDRMEKLCEILGMRPAYECIPDGFETITA